MRNRRPLPVLIGIMACTTIGWSAAGAAGAVAGLLTGVALLAVRWRGLPMWEWACLYLKRDRAIELTRPMTVANDGSGGGVRYQDGVAAVAVQVLGKLYQPTYFTGSAATGTANTLDICRLFPAMRQSLGLAIESISVISSGSRRRPAGDYPRVYDTLIGPAPYAGQRETWLVIRIRALDNGDALQLRSTVGTAALASAQRITTTLRCAGIRARTATATDISELENRLGRGALDPHNRRWQTLRGEAGWQTTYTYRPEDITTEKLAQAWALQADGIVQNVTLFADGTASAMLTVRTPQPPTAPPAVLLQPMPGEQAQAVRAALCCPRPLLRAPGRRRLSGPVVIPIGPSGVLLGKIAGGSRLALPLGDPCEQSRVHVAADDPIVKRIVVRAAAAGERVTVHTTDLQRWASVRMPNVAVIEHPRPAPGTTLSVADGTVTPTPRPNTVMAVAAAGSAGQHPADVVITQTGPAAIDVAVGGQRHQVEVELFRAENRYVTRDSPAWAADLESAY